jgi:hypothetical protein
MVAAFQNCDNIRFRESRAPAGEAQMSGNGDGYGGKITVYHHVDDQRPCSELGTTGRPLPNDSVFAYEEGKAQLVRERCRDIPPRDLAPAEFKIEASGDLTLAGRSFQPHVPTDFEAAAAVCPAGLNPLPAPVRNNLIDNALNLAADPWGTLGGIAVGLNGSIASLPSYLLTRDRDASADPALRLDQFVPLKRNTRYAFSFLARRGSSGAVRLMMFDQSPTLVTGDARWSLADGSLIDSDQTNLTLVSHASRPVGEAFFYTIYFRTPNTVRGLDIGIAADDNGAGASIFATAAQLEDLSTFCGP